MPSWVGRTLGKASVELLLSRDETVEVYLGRHRGLQRAVAVKIFTGLSADDAAAFADFQLDARSLAALQSPHIAAVLESGRVDGFPYLVMEYVPGASLASHLKALGAAGRSLDPQSLAQLLKDVAAGLDYSHQRGVVHGELRPSGIMLTSASTPVEAGKPLPGDFRTVLMDFGLTHLNAVRTIGLHPLSAAYMSPEQAAGQRPDSGSDIYALGIVMYELLAGKVPFMAESASSVIQMQRELAPPVVEALPRSVQDVLDRALQKDPAARYASAGEMVSAFSIAGSSTTQPRPTDQSSAETAHAAPEPRRSRPARNLVSTLIVGAALLVLVAILGTRALIGAAPAATPPAATAPEMTMETPQQTAAAAAPAPGDPIGVLRFQDGAALIDEVTFNSAGMPPLEPGTQYEIWLLDETGEERRSVGYLQLDADGNGSTALVDADGRNLLGMYHSLEITVEPDPDPSPNPDGSPRFAATLPEEGLLHVRHLLVSFSRAPNGIGLLDGLIVDSELLESTARSMLTSYESGDQAATRSDAEAMLNVLVGSQSPDYLDWDGDGQLEDPADGYGLLLNGDNSGYIQGSIAHAGFAVSSPSATSNMQSHGDHVVVSARNLEVWAPELRDLLRQILRSPFDPAMGGFVREAVAVSQNMLAGTDLNGNERVEAIRGEGGAQTAYQHALYMADIVITLPD